MRHFTDHYLEVALNLSDVLFVATANDLSTIPRPLLDRMEIIEVSSYTENEKYHIANDYLVKKQMEANGLNDTQIHWKEDALRFLITDYTREAGVRNLERRIGQVSRKVDKRHLPEETQKSNDHKESDQRLSWKTCL